jgi:glutamate N-acetyltransferase/amino-acid N-acetyltransferase
MTRTDLTSLTAPRGFRAAAGAFGIKASGRPDLSLLVADVPCAVAAMFTTNLIASEPVVLGRRHVAAGVCRAVVVNAGNANAATGRQGMADALAMCRAVARRVGCKPTQVLASSTGIIGRRLPMDKILPGIDALASKLAVGPRADADVARAIMTTDTVPKADLVRFRIGGKTVTIGGVCKGSGMIAPNMATMLAFITTDAAIARPALRAALRAAVNADASLNRLSIDQHTSCSDSVVVLASRLAGHRPITSLQSADGRAFTAALTDLCRRLAWRIITDGEGVTRVIRVRVAGAATQADAVRAARAVVDSPLVKCAVHGADPNWGRIVTAAGYSGAKIAPRSTSLKIGGIRVYEAGQPTNDRLPDVQKAMRRREVVFDLTIGPGPGNCEFLGCDLSRDYITINADYHT